MRSKKVLTLLLVLCMLFNMVAPAGAIFAGSESAGRGQLTQNENNTSSTDKTGPLTLRDKQDRNYIIGNTAQNNGTPVVGGSTTNGGSWSATPTNGPSMNLTNPQLPSHVAQLKEMVQNYKTGEKVTAFVILEEAALAATYSSIRGIPQSAIDKLEQAQSKLLTSMQREMTLKVVDNFTYLTNAIVIETAVENLEKIACMEGVRTVFISPVFYPCETEMSPFTVSSGEMCDVDDVWNIEGLKYTGEGMTIAILDTGLDLDHPSFAAAPEGALWDKDDIAALLAGLDLNAEILYKKTTNGTLTADNLYRSEKVPFAFNYALGTLDAEHNDTGDHGTHVAGISAANAVEGSGVVGMAPNAQVIVMKVFSPGGGADMVDILNAMEDCMTLGVDVANLSLGSPAGFSVAGYEPWDIVFENIAKTDVIFDIAAGNEGTSAYGSMYGNYLNTTGNVDTATVSSPSTWANVLSVASMDNSVVLGYYVSLGEDKVFYQPCYEYYAGKLTFGLSALVKAGELDYVVVPNTCAEEDFYDENDKSIVEGKVAVVRRAGEYFNAMVMNAEKAGAVAVLIAWNNDTDDILNRYLSIFDENYTPEIPVAFITYSGGQKMAAAETKKITFSKTQAFRADRNGGQMSDFSCWGVGPDLSLLPDIAGVGGNVYSTVNGGGYDVMSGTSMATPQVAGITALVVQYIKDYNLNVKNEKNNGIRFLADALMMSTATPNIDKDTGVEFSPRQQGAGLVNALRAVTTTAYLSVNGDRPKAELGDSATGVYSFTFDITNFGDTAKTYTLSSSLLCEDFYADPNYPGIYFMAEQEYDLEGNDPDHQAVTFDKNTVTVAAGATASVTVTITLADADKTWINTYFPNGNYVEGFVYLTDADENGVDLSLPFLGFYGDWAKAPIFDSGFWYNNSVWGVGNAVETNQYFTMAFVSLGDEANDWLLGMNPYGVELDATGKNVYYNPKNNVVSPNGDGLADKISDWYFSMVRNSQYVYLTYTDAQGNVVDVEQMDYVPKTMYRTSYGRVVPFIYSWYFTGLYDFTDAEGNPLPDGTTLTLTISGVIEGEKNIHSDVITIPVTVDTSAPTLDKIVPVTQNGKNYLELTIRESHLAALYVINKTGTQRYGTYSDQDVVDNGDGTCTITLDITGIGTEFTVFMGDYGCNESYYDLTWTSDASNMPNLDPTALYAYQVYNNYIGFYYGYDAMFGWSTINKTNADVTMLQSDAYEYYALTAAEYVDGYIFAVDAVGNFLYMVPGIWDRHVICNIGYQAADMAFDDATGKMYIAVLDDNWEIYGLCAYDLLTGEMDYDAYGGFESKGDMPWSMTFVNGELYCTKNSDSGLYIVKYNEEDWVYELVPVTKADGSDFVLKDAYGYDVVPSYFQSMTYSEADGVIYWAYYTSSSYGYSCCLVTIDPETLTTTAVPFDFDQQYVGLLTLEGTYEIPESEAVEMIVLDQESMVLGVSRKGALSATLLPWNAPVTEELVWTSSDPSVATVDESGRIYALKEGTAIITVTYGELEASCVVNVEKIQGNMCGYKYYDGEGDSGYFVDVDLKDVEEEATLESPVEFLAGEYNGHNGLFYGFDEYGQCYWIDFEALKYGALETGNPGITICDMAYDYSTGLMYALSLDMMTGKSALYLLNMATGALVKVADANEPLLTLACGTDGTLYTTSYYGYLAMVLLYEDDGSNSGIGGMPMPLKKSAEISLQSVGDGVTKYALEVVPILETGIYPVYIQSMCYDHNNDVLLWTNPDTSCLYWIGGLDSDMPFMIPLGDPTGTGGVEYTATYVIPDVIPVLEQVPIADIVAEDMVVLLGSSKAPQLNIYPLNSTVQTVSSWKSSDESIAYMDENGMIVGKALGTVTFTATVVDTAVDKTYEATFKVAVKKATDNIIANISYDFEYKAGGLWIEIADDNTKEYDFISEAMYDGEYLTIYAAEYVDSTGYIYAYGFITESFDANWLYFVIDPATMEVVDAIDMGNEFPFVYDMAFDYTTGTMYALSGPSDQITNLYYVDVATGELILCMTTGVEYMFMSLTFDANGTLYATTRSKMTEEGVLTNAQLYTIDPDAGKLTHIMDTGVKSNAMTSMAYDYDTGNLYWHTTELDGKSHVSSGLYLVDPEKQGIDKLGSVGNAGAIICGLMVLADEYPAVADVLNGITLRQSVVALYENESAALETLMRPFDVTAELTWASSDETVATVDANGVVTGVAAGTATITVTAGDYSASCTVRVYMGDNFFITYNTSDRGFSVIKRNDPSSVTNMTEGETASPVTAMTMVNDYIYAYDAEGNLFITSLADKFKRTYIGNAGIQVEEPYEDEYGWGTTFYQYFFTPGFRVSDMTWDEANQRMLVLGTETMQRHKIVQEDGEVVEDETEIWAEKEAVYEVDLTTGELTELFVVNEETGGYGYTALEAAEDGKVYIHTFYDDYFYILDMETGTTIAKLSSFQAQGVGASTELDLMSMTYDQENGVMYMIFTQNGSCYYLYQLDLATYAIHLIDVIGDYEIVEAEVEDLWGDIMIQKIKVGDAFAGLVINEKHFCDQDKYVMGEYVDAPTCTEGGTANFYCPLCKVSEVREVPANGHSHQSADGVFYICPDCGDSYAVVVPSAPVEPSEPSTPTEPENETIVTEDESGVTTSTVVDKDGNVLESETEIPADVAEDAVENGETVVLDMPAVDAAADSESAPVITVNTNCEENVSIEIPVTEPTAGTVVVIVNEDGSETVVTDCIVTENGIVADLPDGATVKVVDKAMDFDDVEDTDWFSDAVAFVSARGILTGTGASEFGEDTNTSRAMVWTLLARMAGVDTTGGSTWYEKAREWAIAEGITDGTNANGTITREQLITMLWRYIGEPKATDSVSEFKDADKISDWAEAAANWAVENEVMNGYNGNLDPEGFATRAQLAQFIMNFIYAMK